MRNLGKYIFLFVLISQFLPRLYGHEERSSFLYYEKFGAIHSSVEYDSYSLPTFGLGVRFQEGEYGFDFSGSLASMLLLNYVSLKGLFLSYPYPEKRHQLYFGLGSGLGYSLNLSPLGGFVEEKSVNVEGVLGYEFRFGYFKTFMQLELSQPVFYSRSHNQSSRYMPRIALDGGFGF